MIDQNEINAHIFACRKRDCAWVTISCLMGKFEFKDMIEVSGDDSRVCLDNAIKVERCILLHCIHGMHKVRECLCKRKGVIKTGYIDCSSSIN